MGFCRVFWHETFIPLRYAVLPALLSVFLSFLNWHHAIVFVILQLFVFLRIVHREDKQIGRFKIGYVFVKLVVAILMHGLMEWAASSLESNYLPPGVVPSSSLASSSSAPEHQKKTVRIRVSKSKAKYLTENADLTFQETVKVTILRVLVEYIYFTGSIAHYRWCFLGMIFIVYGVLHAILWLFFSPTRKSNGNEDDENSSDEGEIVYENY